jgi:hypothetical protein
MHPLWRAVTHVSPWLDRAADARVPLELSADDEVALVLWLAERFARRNPGTPSVEVRAAIEDARRFLTLPKKELPSIRHPMSPGKAEVDTLTRAIREAAAHRHRLPGASRRAARHVVQLVFMLEHEKSRAESFALARHFLVAARRLEVRRIFGAVAPDVVDAMVDVLYRAVWPPGVGRCGVWLVSLSDGHFAALRRGRKHHRVDVGDLDSALATLPPRLFKDAVSRVLQARRTKGPLRKDRHPPF